MNPNYRHGLTDGGNYRHPVYLSWQNMKARCLNKKHIKYHRYGGRGITICEEWLTMSKFADWAFNNGWKEGLTIDRIDNNGNYEPKNCQWISKKLNSRKKSTTKLSEQQASVVRELRKLGITIRQIANCFNVSDGTIRCIVNDITHV